MPIYEVNLFVDNGVAEDMAVWLRDHISTMLSFEGFQEATWFQMDPDGDKQRWAIHYRVEKMEHLTDYFDHHAAEVQQEAKERFSTKFSAHRRILYERESFEAEVKNG
jgi:hypothetical protein